MTDVPYIPHEEGPLFPDDSDALAEEAATFLRASDRDVQDAVAGQDIADISEASRKLWIEQQLAKLRNADGTEPKN